MPYTVKNKKTLSDHKNYGFLMSLICQMLSVQRGAAAWPSSCSLSAGKEGLGCEHLAVKLMLLNTVLSFLENVFNEWDFVPAQPRTTLQHSAPLAIFPGREPSVSGRTRDFIPGFAKPQPGPESLLHTTPGLRWQHLSKGQNVPDGEFSLEDTGKQKRTAVGHRTHLCPPGKGSKCLSDDTALLLYSSQPRGREL